MDVRQEASLHFAFVLGEETVILSNIQGDFGGNTFGFSRGVDALGPLGRVASANVTAVVEAELTTALRTGSERAEGENVREKDEDLEMWGKNRGK